jgi:hypothetical protein
MDDGEIGFGVYYRTSLITGLGRTNHETWRLFETGYDRAGAIQAADHLLGQTFEVLGTNPGYGTGCGNYFGAHNAPFVYQKSI